MCLAILNVILAESDGLEASEFDDRVSRNGDAWENLFEELIRASEKRGFNVFTRGERRPMQNTWNLLRNVHRFGTCTGGGGDLLVSAYRLSPLVHSTRSLQHYTRIIIAGMKVDAGINLFD